MSSILISGTSGFVGSNLSLYLAASGYNIVKLVRDIDAGEGEVSWSNLSSFIDLDINVVIHLAGKAHDLRNTLKPQEYFDVNTGLTIQLFDQFLKSKASRFIYFSSVKAAADEVDGILTEDVLATPQTVYGQSKQKAEEYILSKQLPQGKYVYILRPCMIHGPGNKGNLNLLFKLVRKGIPYPLAAFENYRSFLFIDNLDYIIHLLISKAPVPSGVYNVSDDDSLSTVNVVKIISQTLKKKQNLWHVNRSLLKFLAAVGDKLRLPINSERLKKLTENYIVSNQKIKRVLQISEMPVKTQIGLAKTIESFNK